MANQVLQVVDLQAMSNDKILLNRINFEARKNKILTIIGPKGSGKSVLLRCLNLLFLEQPGNRMAGQVIYENQNLLVDSIDLVDLRRSISMVFARPTTFAHLSVFENVAIGLRILKVESGAEIGEAVEASLRQIDLWNHLKDKLHKSHDALTVGERQMICLARSLALKPKLILLDEPTSVVGLKYSVRFEQILRELSSQLTIVMTTSSRKQAARISDSTAFLLDGELIEIGKTSDLFMNPRDSRTEDFLTGRFG
jgi:phosphate transport system ATP-binding protein